MKTMLISLIIVFLLSMTSCKREITAICANSEAWRYTALDSNGVAVVQGYLYFTLPDSGHFDGNWSLEAVGSPANIGSQTGSGKLTGQVSAGAVYIELNPDLVDDNVSLIAPVQHTFLQGRWIWSGFPGVLNEGMFTLFGPDYED